MRNISKSPFVMLTAGIVLGAFIIWNWPQQEVAAETAHGNDLFSVVTVPVEAENTTEAVFVLDHLNGILTGGFLHDQQAKFTHAYFRNVGADFQVKPGAKEPKYSIAAGRTNLAASGGNQPARGLIYVAEKSSGALIAYGFPVPRGFGAAEPAELYRLDGFTFRQPVR